ncbi:acid phosphatase/vanadium-dependent haloperoxidase related [candidate division TM7 genomosp. GTL1]|nr:acid phosphatase/vanadium-dependent haloperoxidase related [candidate division TM7 genomosp. GTL1]
MGLSPYLLAAASAWLVAQLCKYLLQAAKSKSLSDVSQMYQSGNMPSSHSAMMAAVTTAIALIDGLNSGLFALSLVITVIVMYDAVQVRRAVGEQGVALREILEKVKIVKKLHHALGHKPLEVAVGAALGAVVAFFITHLSI